MGLLSLFKRNEPPPSEPAATPDAVAQARTQARRRLIGATVLLAIGVIGFPVLFETRPRPVRMDIPIEIPKKENVPPLAAPPAAAPPAAVVDPPADAPADSASAVASTARAPAVAQRSASAAAPSPTVVTERAGEQGREIVPPAAASQQAAKPTTPASRSAASAASAAAMRPPPRSDDGARAQALLAGQPVPAAAPASVASAPTRVVVQVGAYGDADRLREVRAKVEKLGYKTYTQVVETDGQRRTRVRIGPFASKQDADKVAAKIKAAGLPASMLTL